MKNLVLGSGVVVALVFGCGKSSSSDDVSAQGGVSSGRGGESAGGEAGDDGVSTKGGATSSNGGNAAVGGAAVQSGGSPNGGKGGAGAGAVAGAARGGEVSGGASSSSGGADDAAGAPSTGGASTTGGTSSTGGATGAAGASACDCGPLEECWEDSLCVAKSVALPAGFAIDATEVTRSQYVAWLATDPGSDGQREDCAWNTSFAPDSSCMSSDSVCKGSACDRHPQPCVDFCDAAAYCEAIGKHLCGGMGGAPLDMGQAEDPDKSQWQHACTSDGAHAFYTGDAISVGKCNDGTASSMSTREVGGKADCQSPEADFAGVFDLIGNVWEWEDNCRGSGGEGDVCNPRGGSFGLSAAAPQCSQQLPASRAQKSDNVGFRCCTG